MGTRIRVAEPDKLILLYERFRDVCLVEKEVWKEIFMPREVTGGPVRTNVQDRYEVEIDDGKIEDTLEANIPTTMGLLEAALMALRHALGLLERVVGDPTAVSTRTRLGERRECRDHIHGVPLEQLGGFFVH